MSLYDDEPVRVRLTTGQVVLLLAVPAGVVFFLLIGLAVSSLPEGKSPKERRAVDAGRNAERPAAVPFQRTAERRRAVPVPEEEEDEPRLGKLPPRVVAAPVARRSWESLRRDAGYGRLAGEPVLEIFFLRNDGGWRSLGVNGAGNRDYQSGLPIDIRTGEPKVIPCIDNLPSKTAGIEVFGGFRWRAAVLVDLYGEAAPKVIEWVHWSAEQNKLLWSAPDRDAERSLAAYLAAIRAQFD